MGEKQVPPEAQLQFPCFYINACEADGVEAPVASQIPALWMGSKMESWDLEAEI